MAQHFLLTSAGRTLSLASVARMSDEEAERVFVMLRWSDNDGEPFFCGIQAQMGPKIGSLRQVAPAGGRPTDYLCIHLGCR